MMGNVAGDKAIFIRFICVGSNIPWVCSKESLSRELSTIVDTCLYMKSAFMYIVDFEKACENLKRFAS